MPKVFYSGSKLFTSFSLSFLSLLLRYKLEFKNFYLELPIYLMKVKSKVYHFTFVVFDNQKKDEAFNSCINIIL